MPGPDAAALANDVQGSGCMPDLFQHTAGARRFDRFLSLMTFPALVVLQCSARQHGSGRLATQKAVAPSFRRTFSVGRAAGVADRQPRLVRR